MKNLPKGYNSGVGKIKNKRIKKALQFDLANSLLDVGSAYVCDKLK